MLGSVKDHMLSMRENPTYFKESLNSFMQHQAKSAKQPIGNVDKLRKAVKGMMAEAYNLVNLWQTLSTLLEGVESAHRDKSNMAVFIVGMISFQNCCADVVQTIMNLLWSKWLSAPTTQHLPVGASTMKEIVAGFKKRRLSAGEEKQAIFINTVMRTLSPAMRPRINQYELYLFMDSIDTMARRSPSVRGLISQPVASLISQLSILAECQRQFQLHGMSPDIYSALKACPSKSGIPYPKISILPDCAKSMKRYAISDSTLAPWCKRAPPAYPVEQPPTKGRVKKLCDAEAALDKLWAELDGACSEYTIFAMTDTVKNYVFDGRPTQRTSP